MPDLKPFLRLSHHYCISVLLGTLFLLISGSQVRVLVRPPSLECTLQIRWFRSRMRRIDSEKCANPFDTCLDTAAGRVDHYVFAIPCMVITVNHSPRAWWD